MKSLYALWMQKTNKMVIQWEIMSGIVFIPGARKNLRSTCYARHRVAFQIFDER